MTFDINIPVRSLCFGGGYLWVGINKITKVDPSNGNIIEDFNFARSAAGLYFNDMLWSYNEEENSLKVYNLNAAGIEDEKDNKFHQPLVCLKIILILLILRP